MAAAHAVFGRSGRTARYLGRRNRDTPSKPPSEASPRTTALALLGGGLHSSLSRLLQGAVQQSRVAETAALLPLQTGDQVQVLWRPRVLVLAGRVAAQRGRRLVGEPHDLGGREVC